MPVQELANQCTAVVSQQLTMVEATRPYTAEAVQALPASLCNLHAYLTHVAAKIERLADGVSTARAAFLARRRQVRLHASMFYPQDCRLALLGVRPAQPLSLLPATCIWIPQITTLLHV